MNILQTFSFLAFLACGLAITTRDCPSGLNRDKYLKVYGNKCYRFEVNKYATYDKAQKVCQSNKGNLAIVTTKSINNFLQTSLKELSKFTKSKFWIGLKYNSAIGHTYYVDKRWAPFYKFTNYRVVPIVENNECVSMTPSDGKWQIEKCSSWVDWEEVQNHYVCDYQVSQ